MISKEEVEHIAKLARLDLTEQEIEKMQKDLSSVLDYFKLLNKVKTPKKITENISLIRANKGIRKDKIVEKSASLANNLIEAAPDKKDGYIKVKSIL